MPNSTNSNLVILPLFLPPSPPKGLPFIHIFTIPRLHNGRDKLTPGPSLLRKEGRSHDQVPAAFENFFVLENKIHSDIEQENKESAQNIYYLTEFK